MPAREADPAIREHLGPYYALCPKRAQPQGRLLVFLPGTGRKPERFQALLRTAVEIGLHAVALDYDNAQSLKRLCPDGDPACFEAARRERVYGGERIPRSHAIESRAITLLNHLSARAPDEGWDRFLLDGELAWERVVLAGHSQGGSLTGLVARDHRVDRAIFFGNSPSWIDLDHQTPLESYYGFFHWEDHGAERVAAFRRFGLTALGEPADEASQTLGVSGTQVLFSTRPSPRPHSSVVADAAVPRDADGLPAYAPVWRWLLGAGD